MATVILEVPSEKMRPFIQLIQDLKIDKHSIQQSFATVEPYSFKSLKQLTSQYLLFDWEFFSNELEYE